MSIAIAYFYWYYLERTREIADIIGGYVRYWVFFFSTKQVLRSLFAPWKMIDSDAMEGNLSLKQFLEGAFSNLFSRVMGLIMRTVLLAFFVAIEVVTIVIGVAIFVVWLVMPIALVWIIIYSFTKLNV
jgi:hypothetical protein